MEVTPPPPPPAGHERGKSGAFTSDSLHLHFGSPLGGGCARNHGLRIPDRGISGAVTPRTNIYVDSLGRSVALRLQFAAFSAK